MKLMPSISDRINGGVLFSFKSCDSLSMLIAQETLRDALVNEQASVYDIYEELIGRGQLVMVKLIKS